MSSEKLKKYVADYPEDNKELGRLLRCARLAAGIKTRRQMDEITGISQKTLEAWEQGRYPPGSIELSKLLKFLGVHAQSTLEFLWGRDVYLEPREAALKKVLQYIDDAQRKNRTSQKGMKAG